MKTTNQHKLRCPVCKAKEFSRKTGFGDYIEHTNKHIELSKRSLKLLGNLLDKYPTNI